MDQARSEKDAIVELCILRRLIQLLKKLGANKVCDSLGQEATVILAPKILHEGELLPSGCMFAK